MQINDSNLEKLFKSRIVQYNNPNSISELFINDDVVLKIYDEDNEYSRFNISVVKSIFDNKKDLEDIKELVLPKELIIYNDFVVGFSMPYIKGLTLEEVINNNLYNDHDMKILFYSLLNIINCFNKLPFDFFIGDLHEKNIIIDTKGNINIIDPDSFIINNNKLCIDNNYFVGKYINHYYDNSKLKEIGVSGDYYSLLCIILDYLFDFIEDKSKPIEWLKEDTQFKEIYPILDRVDENFLLIEEDINRLFEFKNNFTYHKKENMELLKQLERVRKIK